MTALNVSSPPPPRPVEVGVRVWDLPTRLVHGLLAVSVVALIVTARLGGNAMVWHFRLGYLVMTLLGFRIVWGFVGGRWSRFSSFVYRPQALMRYLAGRSRSDDRFEVGHNPLGGLSVVFMLCILSAQVATGLIADDEIANTGPLIKFVSGEASSAATHWHKGYGQWIIIGVVVLHVAAIAFYSLRRRRLIGPMLHGDKPLTVDVPPSADGWKQRASAAVLLALCAAATTWLVTLGGSA